MKQFCEWQVVCAEDTDKEGNQISWTCIAHAIEERVFKCPYQSLEDAKNRMYPCMDAKPPEEKKESLGLNK